ncbi:unnamed protein product [Rotaria sp. Silwood2]|nr:unnamed protein product [Rotaria sp. Silwood2]
MLSLSFTDKSLSSTITNRQSVPEKRSFNERLNLSVDRIDSIVTALFNNTISSTSKTSYSSGYQLFIRFAVMCGFNMHSYHLPSLVILRFIAFCHGIRGELFPDKFSPCLHVTKADVQYDINYIIIHLKSSKTDIDRKGVNIRLFKNESINCAVHALNCFTLLRNINNHDSPFFLLPSGQAFTRRAFIFTLRHLLLQLGYEASAYSGHSLWVGAATSSAAAGVPDHLIQTLGRWNSLSYLRYIRVNDTVILAAHHKILQFSS